MVLFLFLVKSKLRKSQQFKGYSVKIKNIKVLMIKLQKKKLIAILI